MTPDCLVMSVNCDTADVEMVQLRQNAVKCQYNCDASGVHVVRAGLIALFQIREGNRLVFIVY